MVQASESSENDLARDQAKLRELIESHNRIVFFGGAGVSTESGIPDFRSTNGLYNQEYPYPYPPEQMISHSFFMEHTEMFFQFYRDRMIFADALPNACHRKLAELERTGKLSAVVTQNIDGLHQKAGSENVLELHGSVLRNSCMDCGRAFGIDAVTESTGVPHCECGGVIKPDVVLYEEPLDSDVINRAVREISQADMLIVAGTSLVVYPAASFIGYFKGDTLALVNKGKTSLDSKVDFLSRCSIGAIMDW